MFVFAAFIFIIAIGLLWAVLWSQRDPSAKKPNKNDLSAFSFNGSDGAKIKSIEEARAIRESIDFKAKVDGLKSQIESVISLLKADKSKDTSDVNEFYIQQLLKLKNTPIKTESDFDEVQWLFNEGNLRTDDEIKQRKVEEENRRYVSSGKYESDCIFTNVILGIFGFGIGFIPTVLSMKGEGVTGAIIIGIIPGLLGFLIFHIASSSLNVENAQQHNVPANNPRFMYDKRELTISKISTAASVGIIAHNTHKAVKNIMNVDSWKEMK